MLERGGWSRGVLSVFHDGKRGKEVANSGCEGKGNYLWGERGGIRGEKEENG